MFYKPNFRPVSLPHDPFKAIVSPRPIGWISTINKDGSANLAPYSFFNAIGDKPPMVIFSKTGPKLGIAEEKDSIVKTQTEGWYCGLPGFLSLNRKYTFKNYVCSSRVRKRRKNYC